MSTPKRKSVRGAPSSSAANEASAPSAEPVTRFAQRTTLTWICALVVLIATWSVFQPALDGGWLHWDDDQLLTEKEEWRSFSAPSLGWMFTTFHMGPYQPLSWVSYALDHALHGMDARGYHATNVGLHALAAVALFFAARELLHIVRSRASELDRKIGFEVEIASALIALLWSLHPMRVESVAWITERRDCLSGLFLFVALYGWLRHVQIGEIRPRGRWYVLAVLMFAASLLSKGLGMVFPLVLFALDAWPFRRLESSWTRARALVIEKIPFLILALAAAVLAVVGQSVTGAVVKSELHGFGARVAQSFFGLFFYVRQTIWPHDLMVMYPMRVPLDAGEPRFVLAMVVVTIAAILIFVLRRRAPALITAFVCYVVLVAPILGLVQTGSQLVADRYSYLASVPLLLLLGGAIVCLPRAWTSRRLAILALALVLLVPLARATRTQIGVWHETRTLWEHDLSIDPTDNPARRNLMAALESDGRAARDPKVRAATFARALELATVNPPDAACCAHAAKIYDLMAGDEPARGEEYMKLALQNALRSVELVERTQQRLPDAYESAGVILVELGRAAEAVPYLEKLVALDPADAAHQGLLGETLVQAGRSKDALGPLQAARRLNPDSTPILLDIADTQRLLGDRDAAVEAYRRVVELRRQKLGAAVGSDPEYEAAARALSELLGPH